MFPDIDKQGNIDRKDNVSATKETYFLQCLREKGSDIRLTQFNTRYS